MKHQEEQKSDEIRVSINDNPTNETERSNNNNNNRLNYDDIIFIFVVVGFVCVLGGTVLFASTRPPLIYFKIVSLDITSFTITNDNKSLDAEFNLTLDLMDRRPYLFKPFSVSFEYQQQRLPSTITNSFYTRNGRKDTMLQLEIRVGTPQQNGSVFNSIANDLAINQTLRFTLIAGTRYRNYDLLATQKTAKDIICNGFTKNLTTGSMLAGSCPLTTQSISACASSNQRPRGMQTTSYVFDPRGSLITQESNSHSLDVLWFASKITRIISRGGY